MSEYIGIDYSLGTANYDKNTNIHYGIISLNVLHEYAIEHFESVYGEATCPKCGNEAYDTETCDMKDMSDWEQGPGCTDYYCESCEYLFDNSEAYPEDPVGWTMEDNEYTLSLDSDNDVWVLKSPYYTYVQYCSPCAPGAGHLGHPVEGGPMTYCLGVEWFTGDKAPYPIYLVEDNSLLFIPTEISDNEETE